MASLNEVKIKTNAVPGAPAAQLDPHVPNPSRRISAPACMHCMHVHPLKIFPDPASA